MEIDIKDQIARKMERMRKESIIVCPYCKAEIENDEGEYPCNYLGSVDSGGYHKWQCGQCDQIFWVEEIVERTFAEHYGPDSVNAVDK